MASTWQLNRIRLCRSSSSTTSMTSMSMGTSMSIVSMRNGNGNGNGLRLLRCCNTHNHNRNHNRNHHYQRQYHSTNNYWNIFTTSESSSRTSSTRTCRRRTTTTTLQFQYQFQLLPHSSSSSLSSSTLVPISKKKQYQIKSHAFSSSTSPTSSNTGVGTTGTGTSTISTVNDDGDFLTVEALSEQTRALLSVPVGQFTPKTMSHSIKLLDAWINHSKRAAVSGVSVGMMNMSVSRPNVIDDINISNDNINASASANANANANDNITNLLERIIQENKTGNPNAYFHHHIVQKIITHYITESDVDMNTTKTKTNTNTDSDQTNKRDINKNNNNNNQHQQHHYQQKNCIKRTHELIQLLKKNDIYDDSTMPYNVIIGVLSKCQRLDCAKYSTHLLQEMLELNNRDFINGNLPSLNDNDNNNNNNNNSGSNSNSNLDRASNPDSYNYHYNDYSHENTAIDDDHGGININSLTTKNSRGNVNVTIADTLTFNFIISAWMKLAPQEGSIAGREAMRVLNRMKGSYRLGNTNVKPNMLSFSMTITALLRSMDTMGIDMGMGTGTYNHLTASDGDGAGGEFLTNYRQRQQNEKYQQKHQKQKQHQQHSSVAFHAEEVLQDMIYFYNEDQRINAQDYSGDNNTNKTVKPDKAIFDSVLNALVKLNRQEENQSVCEGYLKRAMGLLQQMEELGEKPDTLTYNSIIAIILRAKSAREAPKYIEEIIRTMKDNCSSGVNIHAKVKTITYNSLIKAYSSSNQSEKAEQVLRRMIDESDNGNLDVRPDTITWNSVIEAHAKSKSKNAVDNATRILHEMSSYDHVQLDRVTMSLMLIALSRSAGHGNKDAGKQAVLILDRMEAQYEAGNELMKPDMFTYTQTIHCIARAGGPNSLKMAMDILTKMNDLHLKGRDDLKPDTVSSNAVLAAMANCETKDAATKAEEFLNNMEKSNDPTSQPNTKSYSTVISALAKSNEKDRVIRAENLLQRMEEGGANIAPNTVTYSTILQVLSKSNDPSAVERAMNILERMEESYASDKSVCPNSYTYNFVMETIANSKNAHKKALLAQDLLTKMVKLATSREDKKSYTIVFNSAIKAIEKSSEKNKAKKARGILKIMKTLSESGQLRAKPTVRTYNAIIRCCSFNSGSVKEKRAAFDIALDAFTDLREDKSIPPDKYTYPMMFKACERLLGKEEEDYDIVKILFYFCCEDGYVDGLILNNLKNYLPERVLEMILQKDQLGQVKFGSLPKSWGRNIRKLKNQ